MLRLAFQVCTEGRLTLEFAYDDCMRIKSWFMAVRTHRELIPKTIVGMHTHSPQQDPTILDQMSKNITRQGITNSTLNYLRVSGDTQHSICMGKQFYRSASVGKCALDFPLIVFSSLPLLAEGKEQRNESQLQTEADQSIFVNQSDIDDLFSYCFQNDCNAKRTFSFQPSHPTRLSRTLILNLLFCPAVMCNIRANARTYVQAQSIFAKSAR